MFNTLFEHFFRLPVSSERMEATSYWWIEGGFLRSHGGGGGGGGGGPEKSFLNF